jgi:hypothetical protein
MKIIRRIVLAFVLLVVVGVFVLYKSIDHILKSSVEVEATKSLNLQTTLGSASLSLFGGELKLDDLKIASPPGYAAPEMFAMGSTDLKVTYSQLRSQPIRIANITLDKPLLVIENVNGSLNFKKAFDGMPKSSSSSTPSSRAEPSTSSSSTKMVIDDLTIKDATVVVRPGIPGLPPEIPIPIATFTMKNIGTSDDAQNGAALQDVVMQIITAMASHASASGQFPIDLQSLLKGNITDVLKGFGAEAQKRVMAAIPAGISNQLNGLLGGGIPAKPGDLLNNVLGGGPTSKPSILDAGKAGDAVQGLLGGGPTSKPSILDPGNAGDALQGLLGGKHK